MKFLGFDFFSGKPKGPSNASEGGSFSHVMDIEFHDLDSQRKPMALGGGDMDVEGSSRRSKMSDEQETTIYKRHIAESGSLSQFVEANDSHCDVEGMDTEEDLGDNKLKDEYYTDAWILGQGFKVVEKDGKVLIVDSSKESTGLVLEIVPMDVHHSLSSFDVRLNQSLEEKGKEVVRQSKTLPSYMLEVQLEKVEKIGRELGSGIYHGPNKEKFVTTLEALLHLLIEPNSMPGPFFNEGFKYSIESLKTLVEDRAKVFETNKHLDEILRQIRHALTYLRPIDLEKLLELLQKSKKTGDDIEGEDVILFVGATGAGKTTTILFLAGVEFEEIEKNGFDHLQPINTPDHLAVFETGCGRKSVTECVMSTKIRIDDDSHYTLCDTAGFFDTQGIEVDIANSIGFARAVHRAKTVLPVLVMAYSSNDRLRSVSQVVNIVQQLIGRSQVQDLEPWKYIFTHCPENKSKRICKQFRIMRQELNEREKSDRMLVGLIDDIIMKTDPDAVLALPLEGNKEEVLKALCGRENHARVSNPDRYFVPYLDEAATYKLNSQLRQLLLMLNEALKVKDFEVAMMFCSKIVSLGAVLPEAEPFGKDALEYVRESVTEARDVLLEILQTITNTEPSHDHFVALICKLKMAICTAMRIEPLRSLCMPESPSSNEFCNDILAKYFEWAGLTLGSFSNVTTLHPDSMMKSFARLRVIKNIFNETIWTQVVTKEYLKGLDVFFRLLDCLVADVESQDPRSANLKLLEAKLTTASFIMEVIKMEMPVGAEKKISYLDNRLSKVVNACEADFCSYHILLESPIVVNTQNSKKLNIECFLNVDFGRLSVARQKFESCISVPLLCLLFSGTTMFKEASESIKIFDEKFVCFYTDLVSAIELNMNEVKQFASKGKNSMNVRAEFSRLFGWCTLALEQCDQFRMLSRHIGLQTHQSWSRLSTIKIELQNYIESIDESAIKIAQTISQAVTSAKDFNTRLRSNKHKEVELLQWMLDTRLWNEWEKLGAEDTTWQTDIALFFRQGLRATASDLRGVMDQIVKYFKCWLKNMLNFIISLKWEAYDNFTEGMILFRRANEVHISSLIRFLLISSVEDSFIQSILGPLDSFSQATPGTNDSPSYQLDCAAHTLQLKFSRFATSTNHLLQMKNIKKLEEILSLLQKSSTWQSAEKFRDTPIALSGQGRHRKLQEAIRQCMSYESLRQKVANAIQECEPKLISFDFSGVLHAVNEGDREDFYSDIASNIEMMASASCLVDHLSPEQIPTQQMVENARDRFRSAVKEVGSRLKCLLANFPKDLGSFRDIDFALANMASIEYVFRDRFLDFVILASDMRKSAEKEFRAQLQKSQESVSDEGEIVDYLIKLKKASREIGCWQGHIDKFIDSFLEQTAKKSDRSAWVLVDISTRLRELQDSTESDDSAIANQIISEHRCFEGAANALWNKLTAQQGITYVINELKLSDQLRTSLTKLYEQFSCSYENLVRIGMAKMADLSQRSQFFAHLVAETKSITKDHAESYSEQIVELSAHIFAYWTLKESTDLLIRDHGNDSVSQFLKKPHAPQVLAMWGLVGLLQDSSPGVYFKNQLAELKTGEGKSIVLGVTAIILALFDCNVTCICYSEYLSKRDHDEFKDMFECFGVSMRVKYSTIHDLCGRTLGKRNIWGVAGDLIEGKKSGESARIKTEVDSSMQVLLIDEVDVFFKDDFYGKVVNHLAILKSPEITELAVRFWAGRKISNRDAQKNVLEAKSRKNLFVPQLHFLFNREINKMSRDARRVEKGNHTPYFVSNGLIAYKVLDGFTTNSHIGYETMFAYIMEHERGAITEQTMYDVLKMAPICSTFSFAELPVMFDVILGLSGTLRGLDMREKQVLRDVYNIQDFTILPSAYGSNKLSFGKDNGRDVILCQSKGQHFLEIRAEIDRRRRQFVNGQHDFSRPVMVFFESSKMLSEFYESDELRDIKAKVRTITEKEAPGSKASAFLKATEKDAVTLMIRDYGRGTDFKCYDRRVLDAGGVHVIQAFYATDLAEEIQIKGRAARQGADGSYSMVLNFEQLERDLGVKQDDFDKMRFQGQYGSILDPIRATRLSAKIETREVQFRMAEEIHYRCLAFHDALASGARTKDMYDFLLELNHIGTCEAYRSTTLKRDFIAARKKRLSKWEHDLDAKRKAAKENKLKLLRLTEAKVLLGTIDKDANLYD